MLNKQPDSCPERRELNAFANGEIAERRLEQLAAHIEGCDSCGAIIDAIPGLGELGLVAELQQLDLAPSELQSTNSNGQVTARPLEVPEELLRAVCTASSRTARPASFDSGKRLANELALGPVHLGRFELKAELGVGTFGYVFKARDTELDRMVALKVQRAGAFATDEEMERFLREARAIAHLNHPGIVSLYESVRSEEDVCYLVTEYIQGESLESQMGQAPLPCKKAASLVASIGDALQYAHQQGIIHRDIKPSNILMDDVGNPHLTDFGLAKRTCDVDDSLTSIGRVMGTPAYMSPEQTGSAEGNVDARTDIYSLGVILYEMLTGERPFQGNRQMLLIQILEDEPRPLQHLNRNVPADLETICLKALSKSPDRRYQSARELAEDLRRFLDGQPIFARPMGLSEKLWRWCRAFPLAASLLLAVPFVSIGGFAYLSFLSTHFVHNTALESTRMEANMLEDINEYYSENVIGPLDQEKVPVTHLYSETPNSLPLPFTFMIDAGERISKNESGMQVKIYSDYPWRESCGPHDDFESRAIAALGLECRTEPDANEGFDVRRSTKENVDGRSYYEFDEIDGEPVLRYARAQVMNQSCVDCHNSHEASPKRDWVVGEVGGVLSITRPLKRDINATNSGLRSAFNLIGGVALFLTGLALCVFWSAKRYEAGKAGVTY